jgi:putative phosphotransacetylase
VFEKVAVRVSDHYMPALHLDFDEANACMYGPQDFAEILGGGGAGGARPEAFPALPGPAVGRASQPGKPALITESDARRLVMAPQLNGRDIHLPKGSILTPSAKDVFLHAHCTLVFE